MINKQVFTIAQTAFPFIKKKVVIDLDNNKLKVVQQSIFRSDEVDIDIDKINPNIQKIKRCSLLWLFISIATTLYLAACIASWFWHPPAGAEEISFYIFGQVILLLGVGTAWIKFLNSSYNLTLFFDRYNNTIAFSLFTQRPDITLFENFIETLQKIIMARDQARSIQSILYEIPTHILVEEFSHSYLDELSKRGVDVGALLSFLQKRVINTQDASHRS